MCIQQQYTPEMSDTTDAEDGVMRDMHRPDPDDLHQSASSDNVVASGSGMFII